jgi:hypothetical protein
MLVQNNELFRSVPDSRIGGLTGGTKGFQFWQASQNRSLEALNPRGCRRWNSRLLVFFRIVFVFI